MKTSKFDNFDSHQNSKNFEIFKKISSEMKISDGYQKLLVFEVSKISLTANDVNKLTKT